MPRFRQHLAPLLLPVLSDNISRPLPYHDSHFYLHEQQQGDFRRRHPAFGNAFDWHSSVHCHACLLELLEQVSDDPVSGLARQRLGANLSAANLASEAAYLSAHPGYERPYGQAWLACLCARLDRRAAAWGLAPALPRQLYAVVADQTRAWLCQLPTPVRHGTHGNTAFALGLLLDAARIMEDESLEALIASRASAWFLDDHAWPQALERSGTDFLSPGLAEAELLARLLPVEVFARWWSAFLPELDKDSAILQPVQVASEEDGHLVHWHGLNLSRAAMLARIARRLGQAGEDGAWLLQSALALFHHSLAAAHQGHYVATHWLPTFAWEAAGALDAAMALDVAHPGA